jgi:hypothetical protein
VWNVILVVRLLFEAFCQKPFLKRQPQISNYIVDWKRKRHIDLHHHEDLFPSQDIIGKLPIGILKKCGWFVCFRIFWKYLGRGNLKLSLERWFEKKKIVISINISSALLFIGYLPSLKFMVWRKYLLEIFLGVFCKHLEGTTSKL